MQERCRAKYEAACAEMRWRHSAKARLAAECAAKAEAGLARMGAYLEASRREAERERYCTAMAGCPTSWPAIAQAALYELASDCKPIRGNKINKEWVFNRRTVTA